MAEFIKITNPTSGEEQYPITSPDAVIDSNGNTLTENMGDLADLETTDKSNLVAAINEAASSGGELVNKWITPEQFNAVGDGITDDTDALRECVKYSFDHHVPILFPNDKSYLVSGALNYYNEEYYNCKVCFEGKLPDKLFVYQPLYGGILLADGASMFEGATISGSIKNMGIYGVTRDTETSIFNDCVVSAMNISYCSISQIGAFMLDSELRGTCFITYNTMLTVYYFSKNVTKNRGITDSNIIGNYINGGAELNDNACFQFNYWNGVVLAENFIDYYRTIFEPVSPQTNTTCWGINSHNNQYQVFRYFYRRTSSITSLGLVSDGDSFNWTDVSTLQKLRDYTTLTYTGRDGSTYDLPPYIAQILNSDNISITNASVENNVGKILFVRGGVVLYDNTKFKLHFNNVLSKSKVIYAEGGDSVYNKGAYMDREADIDGIVEQVDALPTFTYGWSKCCPGQKFIKDGILYKAVLQYDTTANTYRAKFIELNTISQDLRKSGTLSQRPADNVTPLGYNYYCTDLKSEEGLFKGMEIIYRGNGIWTDTLGRIVAGSDIQELTFPVGSASLPTVSFDEPITLHDGESLHCQCYEGVVSDSLQLYLRTDTGNFKSFQIYTNSGIARNAVNDTGNDVIITNVRVYDGTKITQDIKIRFSKKIDFSTE